MALPPNSQGRVNAASAKTKQEATAAVQQSEADTLERDRVQQELYGKLHDLERSLAQSESRLREEDEARSSAEQEIHRLNGELARQKSVAENLHQELESFSYSISHDLRAPLRHLVGFSTALLEDFGSTLEPTAQTYLDCIMRAGRKMEHLIEALLSLSRISRQEMTVTNVDLSHLARQCQATLQESDPARRVDFRIPEQLPVQADPLLMRVALEHLLGNAWKFAGKRERATIEVGQVMEGDTAVYFVRDDGAGFDPRFAERLFGPFQRMHREDEFPGLGIGLATVQRIIHRHGGKIWAEANVDAGATFFFTLPPQ